MNDFRAATRVDANPYLRTLVFTHCREDLLVAMGAPASEEPGGEWDSA